MFPSHEMQHENYLEWRSYLSRFPWQWFATLTIEPGTNYFSALKLFHKWRLQIIDGEKIQIGVYLLSSQKRGNLHFHALMVGKNQRGKTLLECSAKKWEYRWKFFAKICPVFDNFSICDYVAIHFLGFKSDHAEIDSFNSTLLRQVMQRHHDGMDGFDGL